jgi:hypothetical protein
MFLDNDEWHNPGLTVLRISGSLACGPERICSARDLTVKISRSFEVPYRIPMYLGSSLLTASRIESSCRSSNFAYVAIVISFFRCK